MYCVTTLVLAEVSTQYEAWLTTLHKYCSVSELAHRRERSHTVGAAVYLLISYSPQQQSACEFWYIFAPRTLSSPLAITPSVLVHFKILSTSSEKEKGMTQSNLETKKIFLDTGYFSLLIHVIHLFEFAFMLSFIRNRKCPLDNAK